MSRPKVSVCVPTFNRAHYLREALDSVLAQDFEGFELVVVDNASEDETSAVVESFGDPRVRYIRNSQNIGMTGNLNRCLEVASCDYVCVFHDDDRMNGGFLRKGLEILDGHPEVVFVHAQAEIIDANGKVLGCPPQLWPPFVTGPDFIRYSWSQRCSVSFSSVIMRKPVAIRAGLFDPRFVCLCDAEFWQRLAAHGSIAFLSGPLLCIRLHGGSMTAHVTRNAFQLIEEGSRYAQAAVDLGHGLGLDLEQAVRKGWAQKISVQIINLRSAGGSRKDVARYAERASQVNPHVLREPRFWLAFVLTLLPAKATPLVRGFRWRLILALRNGWNAVVGLLQRRPQQDV